MSEYRNYPEDWDDDLELDLAQSIHRNAMTVEELHSKREICLELGWRDMKIAQLEKDIKELGKNNSYVLGWEKHEPGSWP
jgi:hypothetical protein